MSNALAREKTKKELILEGLNEQQRKPVVDYQGASIVLAGAGAGKTRVIVSRTAYMIEDGIDPRHILLFTFTRKGANEIKERVLSSIGARGKGVTVGTYHSFCARLLRRYVEAFKVWTHNFSIYDPDDCESLLKGIASGMGDRTRGVKPRAISSQISRWKEQMKSPKDAQQEAHSEGDKTLILKADIYQIYQQKLREQNAMDFDDLIYYTIRMFEQFPEIKERVNQKYQYIVADESQDSSPRDLELIYHLGGTKMNVCLVGDDYQSIYSFRGSDIESFFTFVKEFQLKKFFLDQNYRSTQTIVNAAQSVVDHNTEQFEKHLFSENKMGDSIVLYSMPDEHSEAQRVTQIVKALHHRGIALKDIAILYRTSYQSRKVEDCFLNNGIQYRMLSGTPFYARKEIKDLMAYLRFLLNSEDQVALERALTRPKRGIGEASLNKILSCLYSSEYDILELSNLKDLVDSIGLKGRAKKGFENFAAVMEELSSISKTMSPVEILQHLIALIGYLPFLKDEDKETYDDRKSNVEELCEIAAGYESLEDFVGNMIVNETSCEEETEEDSVNMLTIHGSKGLEFRAVILIGCNQGSIPHFLSIRDGDISEERRLFYVAMTRAKEFLFLTRAKKTVVSGIPMQQAPSVFLREIDRQYIRKA